MACTSLSGWHGSHQPPITGSVGALPTASGVPTGSPDGRQNDNVLTVSIVSAEAYTVEPLSTRAFSSNLPRPGALYDTLSLTASKKQSAKFAYSDTDRSIALIVVSTRRSSTALTHLEIRKSQDYARQERELYPAHLGDTDRADGGWNLRKIQVIRESRPFGGLKLFRLLEDP